MNSSLKDWVDTIAKALTASGVLIAAWNIWRQSRTRKAEWLQSLFERFYEKEVYKKGRKWIDFELIELELKDDSDHSKEEAFTDFLNFFEFIGSLVRLKQLTVKQVESLFSYYLRKIKGSAFCKKYIATYEFVNLIALLEQIQ